MDTSGRVESEIVCKALGGLPRPPVDLLQIARYLRVGAIRSTDFRDGFTDFSLIPPIIYVNKVLLDTTKRYILAHELGHVMLRLPEVRRIIWPRNKMYFVNDEEVLADRLAATILMPDGWIHALRNNSRHPGWLKDAARSANVSVMMLTSRMASAGVDIALLHWHRSDHSWHVIDRPGAPASLHGNIRLSSSGCDVLDRLDAENRNIVIDCDVSGRQAKISGQAYRNGQHVFQSFEPSIDLWIARPPRVTVT
jgi:uncharacterized protein DUF955